MTGRNGVPSLFPTLYIMYKLFAQFRRYHVHLKTPPKRRIIIYDFLAPGCFIYLFVILFVILPVFVFFSIYLPILACLFILPVQIVKLALSSSFSNPFCRSASYSTIAAELDRFRERMSPHMGIRIQWSLIVHQNLLRDAGAFPCRT